MWKDCETRTFRGAVKSRYTFCYLGESYFEIIGHFQIKTCVNSAEPISALTFCQGMMRKTSESQGLCLSTTVLLQAKIAQLPWVDKDRVTNIGFNLFH